MKIIGFIDFESNGPVGTTSILQSCMYKFIVEDNLQIDFDKFELMNRYYHIENGEYLNNNALAVHKLSDSVIKMKRQEQKEAEILFGDGYDEIKEEVENSFEILDMEMPFGKYKGKHITQINDIKYLEWAFNNMDLLNKKDLNIIHTWIKMKPEERKDMQKKYETEFNKSPVLDIPYAKYFKDDIEMHEFIEECDLIVAHQFHVERSGIKRITDKEFNYFCTMNENKDICNLKTAKGSKKAPKLGEAVEFYGVETKKINDFHMFGKDIDAHDAQGDVVMMIKVFQKMIENEVPTVKDFLKGEYKSMTKEEEKEAKRLAKATKISGIGD